MSLHGLSVFYKRYLLFLELFALGYQVEKTIE